MAFLPKFRNNKFLDIALLLFIFLLRFLPEGWFTYTVHTECSSVHGNFVWNFVIFSKIRSKFSSVVDFTDISKSEQIS